MTTTIRILVLFVVGMAVTGVTGVARAQDWYGAATWQISGTTGDTNDFVDEFSFRGMGLDFRKVVSPNTTAGIAGAWHIFHERRDGTGEVQNVTFTGTSDRYINSFPIMLNVHRYFGSPHGTRPFVGLNAGAFVVIRTFGAGVYETEEDSWDWGVAPEAGVTIPMQRGAGMIINARYNWSFTHQNLSDADEDLTYFNFGIGFYWEQY